MGMYLNSNIPYDRYQRISRNKYFVDKSLLIGELVTEFDAMEPYLCFTRPRRFGKSVMANMVGAFFEKGFDSHDIFDELAISQDERYAEHLNQHNVIYIDFSRVARECDDYRQYMSRIENGIFDDLEEMYSECSLKANDAIWDSLNRVCAKTGEKFIFVLDEWDAPFYMSFITESDQKEYLVFLKNLIKDQVYVELAYMTGVLPIAKYSSGSELNVFTEFNMITSKKFTHYFGFLDSEVDRLFEIYKTENKDVEITREDLRNWYDGYYTHTGQRMYNPRSIVCALTFDNLESYWTSSGPYDEIFYYIQHDIEDIRDDLVLMTVGEGVEAEVLDYAAVSMNLDTKDEIYSAMVVYGLLTYHNGKVYIPNHELLMQFRRVLMTKSSLGYVYNLANESKKMLRATLNGDTDTMAKILEFAHDTESPILQYNNETELSAVVNIVYLSARDAYRVEREDKAGKGFVDFIFYPQRRGEDAIILELKVDDTPENAIKQIKSKNYALRFKGKLCEEPKYKGRILLVDIGYDKETKAHECVVEVM